VNAVSQRESVSKGNWKNPVLFKYILEKQERPWVRCISERTFGRGSVNPRMYLLVVR